MSYTYDFYRNTCIELKTNGFNPRKILDIGAFVCETADIMQDIWPNSQILLFEGNKDCELHYIHKNYNYQLKLLGKESGTTSFYKTKLNPLSSGNSIYRELSPHFDDNNVIIETHPIYKLDDCVSDTYDLIKIDTQGSELDIIKGGLNTVKKAKVLIIEASIVNHNHGGCSIDDILNITKLLAFDYIKPIEYIHNNNTLLQKNLLFIKPIPPL